MPALRTSCLLLAVALAALASGCASTTPKYLRAPSLARPNRIRRTAATPTWS
jgi:type IV pilus biogenesis protein CpaD/CtpE